MADNEINIKCRICGDKFFIAKRFELGEYYRHSRIDETALLDFFSIHHECAMSQDELISDIFDIDYEDPPEWKQERDELATYYEAKLKEANERIKQLERNIAWYERVQQEFFINKAKEAAEK